MRLLALDASGEAYAAALLDGGTCLGERRGGDSRTATAGLTALVQELLAAWPGPLGGVAVTVGPGSFTGLRGALALAHGIALGAGIPVTGVRVAEALRHADGQAGAWVAIDARRAGRVFLDRAGEAESFALAALPQPDGPVRIIGNAAEAVAAALPGPGAVAHPGTVSAAAVGQVALLRLAGTLGPCPAQPLYVEAPAVR